MFPPLSLPYEQVTLMALPLFLHPREPRHRKSANILAKAYYTRAKAHRSQGYKLGAWTLMVTFCDQLGSTW